MKNFIKILSVVMTLVLSSVAFADRIKIPENTQANDLVMSQDYVQQQFKLIDELSNQQVRLIWITNTEVGLREDSGLDERSHSGMKHKFIFTNADETIQCSFSVYIVYQHTVPLSLNKEMSGVTREANCY